MLEQIFIKVLDMSIMAVYCMLVVLCVRFFLRKMPRIYTYVLWFVVFFRLACPVSIKSALSLVRIETQSIPQNIRIRSVPQVSTGRTNFTGNGVTQYAMPPSEAGAGTNVIQIILFAVSVLWAAVALFLILYSIWDYFRLKAQLKDALWMEDNIYEKPNLPTPFVLGIWKPKIYLPSGLKERDRVFVLEHEKTHIRRRDYLVKHAAFLIVCIHWFNPLAWLAFFLMSRDMEMSCDESVLCRLGAGKFYRENDAAVVERLSLQEGLLQLKKEYSASLLALASDRKIVFVGPLAFGEGGTKRRIVNVLTYKRPAFWVSIFFVFVLAVFLIGLSLNPKDTVEAQPVGGQPEAGNTKGDENIVTEGDTEEKMHKQQENGIDLESLSDALGYVGYLDESPYVYWNGGDTGNRFAGLDFDLDGIEDRIFRSVEGETISYRLDFGNGDSLALGQSEDAFVGVDVKAADVDGDGQNEILFVGSHIGGTDPMMMSEIALYGKLGDRYVKIELPKPAGEVSEDGVGYRISADYKKEENVVELYSADADYTEAFVPEEASLEEEIEAKGGQWQGGAEMAYDAEFIEYDGKTCLALYENAGGKWCYWPVGFILNIRPSARSAWQPYDVSVAYAGRVTDNGKNGYEFIGAGSSAAAHREGFKEGILHLYADSDTPEYTDLVEAHTLAVEALRELYDLTGTLVEECYYEFTEYGVYFSITADDMKHGRVFYSRDYGWHEADTEVIGDMYILYARESWYSPVYQYVLPADYETMNGDERAVWFLENSVLYNGKKAVNCFQPYSAMPECWRIVMEDDTAYEISLDEKVNGVSIITGPYPDSNIRH